MKPKKLLVLDALNQFIRAYIVDPSLSSNGQPIGGLKGFLKITNRLVREMSPDRIIVCWDGQGGSQKRKSVNKGYKEGRKPIRLNRTIRNLSENEETANKIWQQTRLFEYLNEMPMIQLVSDGVEADDVISYVVNHRAHQGWQKIIVSSDKDFIQLLDQETVLYRPIQKEVLNKNRVVEKFGIHPCNFALARAIVGDKSDNLSGVGRVGLATVAKRLPFLSEERDCSIKEVVDYCEAVENKVGAHTNIIEGEEIIRENYKLMQLYAPSISIQQKQHINDIFKNFKPLLNKTGVRKMMVQDGIGEISLVDLFQNFKRNISDHNAKK
jgi:5'-3' exonuclease